MKCNQCGTEVGNNLNFCTKCGAPLQEDVSKKDKWLNKAIIVLPIVIGILLWLIIGSLYWSAMNGTSTTRRVEIEFEEVD